MTKACTILLETIAFMTADIVEYDGYHPESCCLYNSRAAGAGRSGLLVCNCPLSALCSAAEELSASSIPGERQTLLERIATLTMEALQMRSVHDWSCTRNPEEDRDCDCFWEDVNYACNELQRRRHRAD